MEIRFENNTLYLPMMEARDIESGIIVPILFELPDTYVRGTTTLFKYEWSDPTYPHRIPHRSRQLFTKKYNLSDAAFKDGGGLMTSVYQLADFCHYMGDATHSSEPVKTPFGFYPGLKITIEHCYNVKPFPAIVKGIRLTRLNEGKWFWLVEFKKA